MAVCPQRRGQKNSANFIAKLVRDQTGAALAEAVVTVPVLLVLFLGVYEFSWVFYQQQLIEIGIRDAARYLSRISIGNPCSQTSFVANAQNLATTGSIDASTPSRVCTGSTCWGAGQVTISCAQSSDPGSYLLPDGSYSTGPYIITVTTSFPDPSLGFFSFLGLTPPNISFTHSERNIGLENSWTS